MDNKPTKIDFFFSLKVQIERFIDTFIIKQLSKGEMKRHFEKKFDIFN